MEKVLPVLFLLFSTICFSSVVDGYVYLDDTTNHSGVIIKFNPISPSAVYAEDTSDISGFYSLDIIDGIYEISYEKTGYQTYILYDQFIDGDTTLESVTLNSNTIVNVSGDVSGNWTNNNTYIVVGDITVSSGQTLTVEAGTEIKFDGYYSLIVNGTLNAIGNENKYIKFTANTTSPTNSDWNQIQINNASTTSELKYCIIEYGNEDDNDQTGLVEAKGNVIIENSIIRYSDAVAIRIAYTYSGDITVKNCQIYDCKQGIYSSGNGQLIVENNSIYNIFSIGIRCWTDSDYTNIKNNTISQCGYGLISYQDIIIERNILFDNNYGMFITDGQPSIINNTFLQNNNGIGITGNDYFNPEPIINSNIFSNSIEYDILSQGDFIPSLVTYNLFYNSGNGIGNNLPVGVGPIVTTNNNGTESDTYYNIFSDPNFVSINSIDSNFCELDSVSDAINAGDPDITNTFNNSIIDIGAKETYEPTSVNQYSINEFLIYPNPVSNQVTIQAKRNQSFNKIKLYNVSGVNVKEYNLGNKTNEYLLTGLDNLSTGIYFANIYIETGQICRIKIIKQ